MPVPPTIRPVPPSSPPARLPQPRQNPLSLIHSLRGRPLLQDIQKKQKEQQVQQDQQRQIYYGPPKIDAAIASRRYSGASKQTQQEQYVPYSRASAYQQRYLLENGPGAQQTQDGPNPESGPEVKENLFVPSGCLRWDSTVSHGGEIAMAPLCCGPKEEDPGFDFFLTDRTPFRAFHCNSLSTTLVTRKFYLTKIHGKTFPFPNNIAYKFTDASIARVEPDTEWWSMPHGCDGEDFADAVCPCPKHGGKHKVETIPEEPEEELPQATSKKDGKVWTEVRKFEDKENSHARSSRPGTKSSGLVLRDRSVNTVSSRFSYTPDMPLSTPLASSTVPSSDMPSSPPPIRKQYPSRTPSLAKRAPTLKPKRAPSSVLEGRYRRTCEKEYTPVIPTDEDGNCDFTIFEGMYDRPGDTSALDFSSTSKSLRDPPPRPEARMGHYEPVSSSISLASTSKALREPPPRPQGRTGHYDPVSSSTVVSVEEFRMDTPPPRPEGRAGFYEPVTSSSVVSLPESVMEPPSRPEGGAGHNQPIRSSVSHGADRERRRQSRESIKLQKRESRRESRMESGTKKPNYDAPVRPLNVKRKGESQSKEDEFRIKEDEPKRRSSYLRKDSDHPRQSAFDEEEFNFPKHLKSPPPFPPVHVPSESFPLFPDLTGVTIYGSVLIPALLLGSHFPCLIPALLVSELPFPEDTDHELWDRVDVALGNDFTLINPIGETCNDLRYTKRQEHHSLTYPFRTHITSSPMEVPAPPGYVDPSQPIRTLHIRTGCYAGPSAVGESHIPNTFKPLSDEQEERGASLFAGYGIIFDNNHTSGANLSITHFIAITEIEYLYEQLAWGRIVRQKPKPGEPEVPIPIEYRHDDSEDSCSGSESEPEVDLGLDEDDEEHRLRKKLGKPVKNTHGFTAGSISGPKTATTQRPVHQILSKLGRTHIPDLIKYFLPLPRILDWSINGSVRGELCMAIIAIIRALKLRDTLGYWWDCLSIQTTSQFLISLFGDNVPPPGAPLSPEGGTAWTTHWDSLGLGETLQMNRDLVCVLGFLVRTHNVTFTLVKRTDRASILAESLAKVAADGLFDAPLDFGEGVKGGWDFRDDWTKDEVLTIEVGNALAGWMIPPGCCRYIGNEEEKEEVIKADRRAMRERRRESRRKYKEMKAQKEKLDAEEQAAIVKAKALDLAERGGWGTMVVVKGLEGYDLDEWHKAGRLGELINDKLESMKVQEEERRRCAWMEGLGKREAEMRRLREVVERREAEKRREEEDNRRKRRFRSMAKRVKVRVRKVMRREY
ncbi:hypothetical protein BJ508DRAFT_363646 [Ascobolus immersus RN42]|uniref:Uncharacterized protein n=1 Tax=Ascobolus immersus RN42 TaxID=1160509 RepID=A0A3N4HY33_ASCIM|nr:hypothetical protein BJ508DRAFT_363646 [Ascobolus immersus RN42]